MPVAYTAAATNRGPPPPTPSAITTSDGSCDVSHPEPEPDFTDQGKQ